MTSNNPKPQNVGLKPVCVGFLSHLCVVQCLINHDVSKCPLVSYQEQYVTVCNFDFVTFMIL